MEWCGRHRTLNTLASWSLSLKRNDLDGFGALISLLSDGAVKSGSALAVSLGVTRSAVWKKIVRLQELGFEIEACQSVGYRLKQPLERLNKEVIERYLSESTPSTSFSIEVMQQVDSTNRTLLDRARSSTHSGLTFLLAEHQLNGRGRRGRLWISPFGRNLYLSALWRTEHGLQGLDGLSLAIGAALASLLNDKFSVPARLKWPNDILVDGRKLGGILLEVEGDLSGPMDVVIGVGLNIDMPSAMVAVIDQPNTDMLSHSNAAVSRNRVAAAVIARISETLIQFDQQGFAQFRKLWCDLDALSGREIEIHTSSGTKSGTARGVNEGGALLLEVGGRLRTISAGDVSLRAVQ